MAEVDVAYFTQTGVAVMLNNNGQIIDICYERYSNAVYRANLRGPERRDLSPNRLRVE